MSNYRLTWVKVMFAPRVMYSANLHANIPQSDPFICIGISWQKQTIVIKYDKYIYKIYMYYVKMFIILYIYFSLQYELTEEQLIDSKMKTSYSTAMQFILIVENIKFK